MTWYFFNFKKMARDLANNKISSTRIFIYFAVLSLLSIYLLLTTNEAKDIAIFSLIELVMMTGLFIFNKKIDNKNFFERYFSLSLMPLIPIIFSAFILGIILGITKRMDLVPIISPIVSFSVLGIMIIGGFLEIKKEVLKNKTKKSNTDKKVVKKTVVKKTVKKK